MHEPFIYNPDAGEYALRDNALALFRTKETSLWLMYPRNDASAYKEVFPQRTHDMIMETLRSSDWDGDIIIMISWEIALMCITTGLISPELIASELFDQNGQPTNNERVHFRTQASELGLTTNQEVIIVISDLAGAEPSIHGMTQSPHWAYKR